MIDRIGEEARELLEDHCSFAIGAEPSGLYMLPTSDNLQLIAGDGSGGCFYEWKEQKADAGIPIVYLSSYGETSRFANCLHDALLIVISYTSYWCDVLVAAHKSQDLLELVIQRNEEDLDEDDKLARERLRELLGLDDIDMMAAITTAVNTFPEFRPDINNGPGEDPTPASFKDRPYPK